MIVGCVLFTLAVLWASFWIVKAIDEWQKPMPNRRSSYFYEVHRAGPDRITIQIYRRDEGSSDWRLAWECDRPRECGPSRKVNWLAEGF